MKMFGRTGGHPNYHKNLKVEPTEACVYCGRGVRTPTHFVFLDTGGDPTPVTDDGDFLGYYPIGSDCAKLATKAGIKVYPRNELS